MTDPTPEMVAHPWEACRGTCRRHRDCMYMQCQSLKRFKVDLTAEVIATASAETDRLQRELNITNADHIALWLEANMTAPLAWLACRIAEAHEATALRAYAHIKPENG